MSTWTTVQDFPAGIRISDVSITAEDSVGFRENPFSFHQEVQVFAGQRMKMRVSFLRQDPEDGGRLEAFLLKLRSGAGTFRFHDPYHSEPMGQAMGTPIVTVAAAGAQTLTTSGWVANVNKQLKAGDYIQIEDNLHRILDDVNSDSSGNATLTVWPNLRATHSASTEVKVRNANGLWRLQGAPQWQRAPGGQKHITTMQCVEAR